MVPLPMESLIKLRREFTMNRSRSGSVFEELENPVLEGSGSTTREVLESLEERRVSVTLRRVERSALGYLVAQGLKTLRRPWLVIAPTDREAENFVENVGFFLGREYLKHAEEIRRRIRFLPSRTGHKVQSLGKMETTARRLESLFSLRSAAEPICVVTSAQAALERVVPADLLMRHTGYLVKGDEIDLDDLCRKLAERGYYRAPLVAVSYTHLTLPTIYSV